MGGKATPETNDAGGIRVRHAFWEKIALILISGFLYGIAIAAVGVATRFIPPVPLTVLRLAVASIVFGAILLYLRPGVRWRPRLALDLLLIGVANIGVPFILLALSLRYISGSLAAVVFNLSPAMTVVLAHFMLPDEKMRRATMLGTLIAVSGAVILLGSNTSGLQMTQGRGWIGQLMIIVASAVGAWAVVYMRIRLRRENTTVVAAGQVFTSLAAFLVLALLMGDIPQVTAYPWQAWAAVLTAALTAPVLGFWLLFYMVNKYSATLGGFAGIATPVFSAALGILFLGEVLTLPMVVGTLLLLAGVWALNKG